MDESPGNGGPLHLASAELVGKVHGALSHANLIQHGQRGPTNFSRSITAEQEWQLDILHNAHGGKQVEELEDDSQFKPPVLGQGLVIRMFQVNSVHDDLARCGAVEASQQVEERAFARAACTRDGKEFTASDFQRNGVEGSDRRYTVGAGGFDETDHAVHK